MAKFCGKCGAALNERGLCPVCDGASLQPKAPVQPVQPVRAVQPEKPAQTLKPMRTAKSVQPAESVQPAGAKKMKFCGRCGGPIDPKTGSCLRCGGAKSAVSEAAGQGKRQPAEWKLPEETPAERKPTEWKLPEQELPEQPPERKPAKKRKPTKKKRHTALWIVLAIVVVLLAASAGAAHFRLIPLKGVIRVTEKVENALGITPYGGRKLLSETAYNDDGRLLWYIQYAYGRDGKMSSVTSYDAAGEQTGYVEIQYDEKGRQLIDWRRKNDGSVEISFEIQYLSDTERKVSYTDSDHAGWYEIQQLDRNGNATRVESYNGDGTLYDTEHLEYDGEGRLKESRRVYPANGTLIWTNPSHVLCEYSGRTGTEKVYYTEGEWQKSGLYRAGDSWLEQRCDFTYNSRGNMTSWTEYQWKKDTETMEKDDSQQFSFDWDGTCTGYETFDGSGQRTMYVEYELQTFWESLKPGAASSGKKPAGADAQSAAGTQNGPITLQQVMDGMEAAAKFYEGWFYSHNFKFLDENDMIEGKLTNYYAVDYHDIHTLEEWKAEARKYYTEDVVAGFLKWDANLGGGFQGWLERDGKLYMAMPTGLGDNFLARYHVELVSSTETQAVVAVHWENSMDHSIYDPYTLNCTLENGNLVFDTILVFPQVEPYFVEYDPQSQS